MCQEGANLVAKAALEGVFANAATEPTDNQQTHNHGTHQNDEATIFQGTVLTLADGKFSPVDAISIKGDTIISVGSLAEVQRAAGSNAPVRQLAKGQIIVPGFIDPHLHLLFTVFVSHESIVNFSPSGVKTLADAHAVVEQAIEKRKPGE